MEQASIFKIIWLQLYPDSLVPDSFLEPSTQSPKLLQPK